MSLILDDLVPLPQERFPQAVAERRFALVAVSEFVIADLVVHGLVGRVFKCTVEGLPADAVICGVYPEFQTGCVMLRFVHPDLSRVHEGAPIPLLNGTISIVNSIYEDLNKEAQA